MKKGFLFFFLTFFCLGSLTSTYAQTEVYLDIYRRGGKKIEIAVPDFSPENVSDKAKHLSKTMADILKDDLKVYGFFNLIENPQFLKEISDIDNKEGRIVFKEWSLLGADALVKGSYSIQDNSLTIESRLFDVIRGKQITGKKYSGSKETLRKMIHRFSDEIVYRFTGEKGIAQTKIALESKYEGHKEIYIMDYDGYNIQRITGGRSLLLSPEWSPDGKKILFTFYRDNNPDLYIKDLTKGDEKPFSLYPGLNISPAWSPDGKKLSLVLSKDGNPEIYTMNSDGSNLQRLTNNRAIDSSPCWSPNGRQIAFTSDRSGSPQIYVMDSEGTNLRRLTYEGSFNDQPAWSPKGDKIAFVSKREGLFNIYVMSVDGRSIRQLTSHSRSNESPVWSPDGRLIAFSSTRKGKVQIFFMNANGTNQKALTSLKGGGYNPAWGPRTD
ncbi:MAG TPA: Tol-Pal system beta propeller repeat protein TolB [Nitrospinota bacterium]|nr:Tol-Pal system beta propeller repeat protein TolB [Nitrospinota bacterium]